MSSAAPLIDVKDISKQFGSVIALSGVHAPSSGQIVIDGRPVALTGPRDALDRGVATVFQDLAMIPLMSITRNFFMGREVTRGAGPMRRFDVETANRVAREEM